MNNIAQNLEPLKNKLRNHSLYSSIKDVDDLKIFTNAHVYAVWDFMSLLKFLQINLTTISVPWYPSINNSTAKLINEIVAGEETDEDEHGRPMSHFEMYLDSIDSFGVKTDFILKNINSLNSLDTINSDIEKLEIKDYIKDFLKFTFSVINKGKIHEVAAVFTFGREDLIPDMFTAIVKEYNTDNKLDKFVYYLERHIELDGGEHGPLALQLISDLCGDDDQKWNEVESTAVKSLIARKKLWDSILSQLS